MLLFRIIIALCLLAFINFLTTDKEAEANIERLYHKQIFEKTEREFRETLKRLNVEPLI